MNFGEKCLNFRARFSLTQNDLAEMFEVTPLMVSRYENGYAKPREANKMRFEEIMEKAEVNFK
jgi:transcriptional regulator with XRE-family HTH domain